MLTVAKKLSNYRTAAEKGSRPHESIVSNEFHNKLALLDL